MNFLWALELLACSYMTGLILLIHFVHYPSFALIRSSEFIDFSRFHSRMITPIVFPGMIVELSAAIALLFIFPSLFTTINTVSVAALWLITGLKSAHTHSEMAIHGFTLPLFQDLMKWNKIRMFIWSGRFIALCVYCLQLK